MHHDGDHRPVDIRFQTISLEHFKKFCGFIAIIVTVLAIIGGAACLFYYGHIMFGVATLCLAAMALMHQLNDVRGPFE